MQQASTPWGDQASRRNGSYPADAHPGYRHRAQTAPALPSASNASSGFHSLPLAPPRPLVPGYGPQTIHRPDLFFSNSAPNTNSPMNQSYDVGYPSSSPPHPSQHHLGETHYQSFPYNPPPLPAGAGPPGSSSRPALQAYRSLTSPPQIPPKTSFINSPQTLPYAPNDTRSPSPMQPLPHVGYDMSHSHLPGGEEEYAEEEADDDGLAVALALSQSESTRQQEYLKKLASQEEEELSRALAESMLSAPSVADHLNDFASSSNHPADDLERALAESLLLTRYTGTSLYGAIAGSSTDIHPPQQMLGDTDNGRVRGAELVLSSASAQASFPSSSHSYPSSTSPKSSVSAPSALVAMSNNDEVSPTFTINQERSKGKQRQSISELAYLSPGHMSEEAPMKDSHAGYPSHAESSQTKSSDNDIHMLGDEALARRLASEEEEQEHLYLKASGKNENISAATSAENQPLDLPVYSPREKLHDDQVPPQAIVVGSISDDEALARKLAAEDEAAAMGPMPEFLSANELGSSSPSDMVLDVYPEASHLDSGPPSYLDAALATSASGSNISRLEEHPPRPSLGGSSALYPQVTPPVDTGTPAENAGQSTCGVQSLPVDVALLRHEKLNIPQESHDLARRTSSASSSSNTTQTSEAASSTNSNSISDPTILNVNHFIDTELLRGVSIGFAPPKISAQLVPMQGPLPNIISLPYGKSPALHIHAPNWRHALKLMARMSGSRMEPAVEALAVTKNDNMKLRTVVQFVKTHHMSNEWRTLLWFTIDHPVPPRLPNLQRYNSQNVNILPWSYTLSKVPDLLRDASDGPLSKTYTIPATEAVPYPTLPITLPNLAMYLQAALDDSRNYLHDSSSGFRKLAKMMQVCYPSAEEDLSMDPPERSSVTGLFKRVIGRGPKNAKKGRGMNEDTYDLVTPFVPDEWG